MSPGSLDVRKLRLYRRKTAWVKARRRILAFFTICGGLAWLTGTASPRDIFAQVSVMYLAIGGQPLQQANPALPNPGATSQARVETVRHDAVGKANKAIARRANMADARNMNTIMARKANTTAARTADTTVAGYASRTIETDANANIQMTTDTTVETITDSNTTVEIVTDSNTSVEIVAKSP